MWGAGRGPAHIQGARVQPGEAQGCVPGSSFQVPDQGRSTLPPASACMAKQTSCSRRQLRSVLRALPPPNPTRASKPRKSNQIGRSNLERLHPWGKGEGTSLFSFSPFELPTQKRPQPTLECHPSTRIVGMSHLFIFIPPPQFSEVKPLKN